MRASSNSTGGDARPISRSNIMNKTTTLDAATLASLHKAILGASSRDFPDAWKCGFTLRESGLLCGLRQREGGPCGVLAAVQAYALRDIIAAPDAPESPLVVSRERAGEALVASLSHVIWAARVGRVASVVGCRSMALPPLLEADGAFSSTQCGSAAEVAAAVRACIGAFMRLDGPGVAMLVYSLALTRGLAMVQRDADFPCSLILPNGYCAQELVNLLLIGRGHSNVFDGERSVGAASPQKGGDGEEEGSEGVRLRGVPRRALVGFLTLFEKQGSDAMPLLEVGSRYKRPAAPVFVVQSESHYSVLWAEGAPPDVMASPTDRLAGDPEPEAGSLGDEDEELGPPQLAEGEAFDVFYFDQMGERDSAVRLTLRRNPAGETACRDLPPLELVLLTRWPAATIDWNGEEAIL